MLEDRLTPANFVVNTLEEFAPPPPPPGGPPPIAWVTLRDAIIGANSSGEATNSITSRDPMGNPLTGAITLLNPLPAIANNVSIIGPPPLMAGFPSLTIQRDNAAPAFRILTVETDNELNLSDVQISKGDSDLGGGILVELNASANIYDCVVSNNLADDNGGGILNDGGTVWVVNSKVSSNTANRGGGIFNSGSLHVTSQSLIYDNRANIEGGGIFNAGSALLVIYDSVIQENRAGNFAALNIGRGGGILNRGQLEMSGASLLGNRTVNAGGGLYSVEFSSASLVSVTISGNSANNGFQTADGGGFYVEVGATLSCTECTLWSNTADRPRSRGGFLETGATFSWLGPPPADAIWPWSFS